MATDHKLYILLMLGQKCTNFVQMHKVLNPHLLIFYIVGERYLHACLLPDKVRKKAGTQLLSNQRYESHSSGVCY